MHALKRLGAAVALGALTLSAAACGSSTSDAASGPGAVAGTAVDSPGAKAAAAFLADNTTNPTSVGGPPGPPGPPPRAPPLLLPAPSEEPHAASNSAAISPIAVPALHLTRVACCSPGSSPMHQGQASCHSDRLLNCAGANDLHQAHARFRRVAKAVRATRGKGATGERQGQAAGGRGGGR